MLVRVKVGSYPVISQLGLLEGDFIEPRLYRLYPGGQLLLPCFEVFYGLDQQRLELVRAVYDGFYPLTNLALNPLCLQALLSALVASFSLTNGCIIGM